MEHRRSNLKLALGAGCALAVLAAATMASAEERAFSVASTKATDAIPEFARQAGIQIVAPAEKLRGLNTPAVNGRYDTREALAMLIQGTGLHIASDDGRTVMLASDPQSGSAAGDGADQGTVQALVVTAQKREENIQDVPIAMSAFTQEDLTKSQVTGGPDLMTQVPNFTFTKTNFTGYSIQIRGIGTQAISATTDAAVAVAENNTPFIRNRFFEQEFYDLERVEVLRGPQGTLYGRNATAGVVNVITAKPKFSYDSRLSADVGNYNSTRFEGMVNLPLVEDKVALRLAGAWTKRDGYDTNQITGNRIDGRNLWSTRLSLRFEPTDNVHANLIWEHFQENDDRLRSGKQLCQTDEITSITAPDSTGQWHTFQTTHTQTLPEANGFPVLFAGVQGTFSQGCKPASLYSPDSFSTPNGLSLPYYLPLTELGMPAALTDPYVSRTQSRDLRVIESSVDPQYRAKNDTAEFQLSVDLADHLTLTSETGYNADRLFSEEDYNRFNTASGAFRQPTELPLPLRQGVILPGANGGIFCDPQVGCSDRMVAVDVSTASSRQFSEELRLASDFDGRFNFSLGANFLRYDTEDKYYVFINTLTLSAANRTGLPPYLPGVSDNSECLRFGLRPPDPNLSQYVAGGSFGGCGYIDPNPIGSLNDEGHNYFLSRNPYKLISYAIFGETYYNITENLKLTAGLRWTVDKKEAPRIPSWVLASDTAGYPTAETIRQEWREPTGRLALDWKPDLSFTDETLVYASFSRGYKAGGANPPATGIVCYSCGADAQGMVDQSKTHPKTFEPEFVNAYEVGSKNTLLDGRLTLNGDAFYYNYTGYQISQIVDRSAVNLNFDARVWGLELEADWRPVENLRLGFKGGYENTRVANGMKAIDLMDRTAGDPNWIVVRPFPTFPSNCILPRYLFVGQPTPQGAGLNGMDFGAGPQLVDLGGRGGGSPGPCELAYAENRDPVTDAPYIDLTTYTGVVPEGPASSLFVHPNYPGFNPATAPNHGEGIEKNLSGNELPNAPHYTATVTADYTVPMPNNWLMTLHGDFYYQSEAWARIFNTPGYDKLKAYNNVNFAAIFSNEDAGWKVMAYVKNVFDKANITGAFLNSDDTGLTTNVFLNEPRLYGLRVTKEWTGQGWWTGANPNHTGPYPLTIEFGGMVQRESASYETLAPSFANVFSAALNPVLPQHRRLDWGDGRQVKITYSPAGSPWRLNAGLQYGRTNTETTRIHAEEAAGERKCGFLPDNFLGYFCDPNDPRYQAPALQAGTNWSDSSARQSERHSMADFSVGRDVGIGIAGRGETTLAGGFRYAQFKSKTDVFMDGIPNWYVPNGWAKYTPGYGPAQYAATHSHYRASLKANRDFSGMGPEFALNTEQRLFGSEAAGRIDVDMSMTAGVIFGKQKAIITGVEEAGSFSGQYATPPNYLPSLTPHEIKIVRSKSASVPMIDVGLGLSYDIQRIKVSTGYRWERYFNAIDGGFREHKSYDRTFEGPYFKIAVGFGG